VDLRRYRDGADRRDAKFTDLAADFAATIRGLPKEDLLSEEVRQTRRALTYAWGAAAGLLLFAVGPTAAGFLAYRAQQEAVAQRNRAERTLAAATATANGLVFNLANRFRNAVGIPAAIVQELLERAQTLQDELLKFGELTPDLKRSEGAALGELSTALLSIGDTSRALAVARQALQIDLELLATNPDDKGRQLDVAVEYSRLGDVQKERGDLAEAIASYRSDLNISETLARLDPENAEAQRGLWTSYGKLGDALLLQGDFTGGAANWEAASSIVSRLEQSHPDDVDWQYDLALSYEKIGDVQFAQNKFADALVSYRQSVDVREKLEQAGPGNTYFAHNLAVSYEKVGDAQKALGDFDAALTSYRNDLQARQWLGVNSDRSNTAWAARPLGDRQ
jgi:tetratricopeptide (TPR) repeat protein